VDRTCDDKVELETYRVDRQNTKEMKLLWVSVLSSRDTGTRMCITFGSMTIVLLFEIIMCSSFK
jgi:hypothetical protein